MAGADFSEIVIAQRRDDEQMRRISEQLAELARNLFGDRFLVKYHKLAPILSAFSYLASTNAFNFQTLGEEYVGLLQIDPFRELPSFWRRMLFIIIDGLAGSVELGQRFYDFPRLSPLLDALRIVGISRLLNAIFLIIGSQNYKLGMSLARISYLSIRPQHYIFPASLRILIGFSVIIQFIVIFVTNVLEMKARRNQVSKTAQFVKRTRECKICASTRQHISLPCGHILCAGCISDFIEQGSTTVKCAYCRNRCPYSRLIPLLNF